MYGASDITVAEGADVSEIAFNWGGEGNITVNGTVRQICVWSDRKPEDAKKAKIEVSGTASAKLPFDIYGRDAAISAKIPLDVVISSTALRTVVNFEPGSGNSTVTAYIEAEINNHSGQEILFNGTGR